MRGARDGLSVASILHSTAVASLWVVSHSPPAAAGAALARSASIPPVALIDLTMECFSLVVGVRQVRGAAEAGAAASTSSSSVDQPRCRAHGGGKRCKWDGCSFSAQVPPPSPHRCLPCVRLGLGPPQTGTGVRRASVLNAGELQVRTLL
jgi:hypothetical protein